MHRFNIALVVVGIKSNCLSIAVDSAFKFISLCMRMFVALEAPENRTFKALLRISAPGIRFHIMALNINLDYSFIVFQTNKWIFNILAIILVYFIEHLLLSFLLNNGRIGLWTDKRSILLLFCQYLLLILLLDEVVLWKRLLNNIFLLDIKTCFLRDSDQLSWFLRAWANSLECLIYLEEYVFIHWHVVVQAFCRLGLSRL